MLGAIVGLAALWGLALCDEGASSEVVWINSAEDFVKFSVNVSSGQSYEGKVVVLGSDIDFGEELNHANVPFSPIGNTAAFFRGVFDGQGHMISNLRINANSSQTGLFGYSRGATLKNVVLDSTCSVECVVHTDLYAYVGGIIGYCEEEEGKEQCVIVNNINMANVSFSGSTGSIAGIGGVAGHLNSLNMFQVENCANYGNVEFSKNGDQIYAYVGGIAGFLYGENSVRTCYVNNNLNAGTVSSKVDSEGVFVGGLVGYGKYVAIRNCVSTGKISASGVYTKAGALAGYLLYSEIGYFYWDLACGNRLTGREVPYIRSYYRFNSSDAASPYRLDRNVSLGSYTGNSLIEAVNAFVDGREKLDYSHWALNKHENRVSFVVNNETEKPPFALSARIILLPRLADGRLHMFDGWYRRDEATFERIKNYTIEESVTLYGRWKVNNEHYTIKFENAGDSPLDDRRVLFWNVTELPTDMKRRGCSFSWWENEYGERVDNSFRVKAHNITLRGVWACTRIESPTDFSDLAKSISTGASFSSETIYLYRDIDLSEHAIQPIGNCFYNLDNCNPFAGVFDGLGHTISNLRMNTSFHQYVGLFGYSEGSVTRNLVLDSSCAIVSAYADKNDNCGYVGGIYGYCDSYNGPCQIENSVNMGSVMFSGIIDNNLHMGGFAGYLLKTSKHSSIVRNSVNYGPITSAGICNRFSNLGGIVGVTKGLSDSPCEILNSMNYGVVSIVKGATYPSIGGLSGYNVRTRVKNCVNFGEIKSVTANKRIGAIVGDTSFSEFFNLYWDSRIPYDAIGRSGANIEEGMFSFDSATLASNDTSNTSLQEALNALPSADRHYSRWVRNENKGNIIFIVNNTHSLTLSSPLILLPDLVSSDRLEFKGWYTDKEFKAKFEGSNIGEHSTLYGKIKLVKSNEEEEKTVAALVSYIVFPAVSFCFIVAIVAIALVYKLKPRIKKKKYMQELIEPLIFDRPDESFYFLNNLYPKDYKRVTLSKALSQAGICIGDVRDMVKECKSHVENLQKSGSLPTYITLEDAEAIAMYTLEREDITQNPYRKINDAFMKEDYQLATAAKDLIYNTMTALRKMPIVYGKTLYRGIRQDVLKLMSQSSPVLAQGGDDDDDSEDDDSNNNSSSSNGNSTGISMNTFSTIHIIIPPPVAGDDEDDDDNYGSVYNSDFVRDNSAARRADQFRNYYSEGEEISWPSPTSTSTDVGVTRAFLAKGTKSKKAEGTLFIIENGWGYDVQSCSMYPREAEIILEPFRRFKVKAVIPGEGLTVIKMEMLKTPILLPEVFGKKTFSILDV